MAATAFLPKSTHSMSTYHNPPFHDYGDQVNSHPSTLPQQGANTDPSLFAKEQGPSHIATSIVPSADVFQAQSAKKRRASKGKIPAEIRRSASSPHIRSLATPELGSLSPTADKRRSKLGYHRTAVACGHCRRRKIRCLVSQGDLQGRCANCIRLKKECNFYPVEQSESQGQQTPSGGKSDETPLLPSSADKTPPRNRSNASADTNEEVNQYRGLPSASSVTGLGLCEEYEGTPLSNSASVSLPSSISVPSDGYPYPESVNEQWQSPPYAGAPYGGDIKHHSHQSHSVVGSGQALTYGSEDAHGWTIPQRSMSYSQVERSSQHYIPQHVASQEIPSQTAHFAYPAPLNLRANSIGSTTAPLSAPLTGHAVPGYGYQPVWNPSYGVHPSDQDIDPANPVFSSHWFPEPGQLQKVDEEHSVPAMGYPSVHGYYTPTNGRRPPG